MPTRERRGGTRTFTRSGRGARLVFALALLLALAPVSCLTASAPTLVEEGEAALSRGDLVSAQALYREAIEREPRNVRAWHGLAQVALAQDDPEFALGFYVEVARLDRVYLIGTARSHYVATLIAAGRARQARGHSDGAVRALKAAHEMEGNIPGLEEELGRALTLRAERLSMLGRRKRALADFQEAIELVPSRAGPYVGAVEILLASGRKDEALELLTAARRHHPADIRVRALTVEAVGLH